MKDTKRTIIEALTSSLTNGHTVKVGYISKGGEASERIATVNYIKDGIVNFATATGFRSMVLDNVIYADIRY